MKYSFLFAFTLILILGFCSSVNAQTSFNLTESPTSLGALDKSENLEKQLRADSIFHKLIAAKGDYRLTPPPFQLVSGEENIAFLTGDGLSIGMEEKGFDVLDEFGDAGLAFILAHEITHFYEKHPYKWKVYYDFKDKDLNRGIDSIARVSEMDTMAIKEIVYRGRERLTKRLIETEADYLGGFLAYSAGYDVSNIPAIIDRLYKRYGYDDEIFGYASRQGRKQMAKDAEKQMNDFIDIYELANMLTVMGRYADARLMYRHILQNYQGREIYNNLGVLTTLEALSYFTKEEMPYHLPLELDLYLNKASKGGLDEKEIRDRLLNEAKGYFNGAIGMDENYAPGYLNLACVLFLQGDYQRAEFYANVEARQRAATNPERFSATPADAEVLLALLDVKQDREPAAIARLEKLSDKIIAQKNLAVIRGEEIEKPTGEQPLRTINWSIDDVSADNLESATANLTEATYIKMFGEAELRIWDRPEAKAFFYTPSRKTKRPGIRLIMTKPGYSKDIPRGYKLGETKIEDIEAKYGSATRIQQLTNGSIHFYEGHAMLVLDEKNALRRWVLYK